MTVRSVSAATDDGRRTTGEDGRRRKAPDDGQKRTKDGRLTRRTTDGHEDGQPARRSTTSAAAARTEASSSPSKRSRTTPKKGMASFPRRPNAQRAFSLVNGDGDASSSAQLRMITF